MSKVSVVRDSLLRGVHVVDGGMASELEHLGVDITGPLWSARALEEATGKIVAAHRAYIEAGADIIETASYQVSRMGYMEAGIDSSRADAALLRSAELAHRAAAFYPDRRILIAVSLGPYGAALHNGAEYHGDYNCTFEDLVEFHRQRIDVLAAALPSQGSQLLAFETLPSLAEAEAIGQALAHRPELAVWFSFTCPDAQRVAHGELLRQCARAVAEFPQTAAIGVNCTRPDHINSLIAELLTASDKPIIVYPNSGEGWDAKHRCWTEGSHFREYGEGAREWFATGAQIVGGCCRTRPAQIREVSTAARLAF
jgi:homocysteine S-methyltransferase